MEIRLQDLHIGQLVYDVYDSYVIFAKPELVDGEWQCIATSDSYGAYMLSEGQELFDNYELR